MKEIKPILQNRTVNFQIYDRVKLSFNQIESLL